MFAGERRMEALEDVKRESVSLDPDSRGQLHFVMGEAPGVQVEPGWRSWIAWASSPLGELSAAIVTGTLLAGGFLMVATGIDVSTGHLLYWLSLGIGMIHGGRAAFGAIASGKFDIDVLMVVGAGMAAYVGAPGEGALLLFLFVLSGALEELASARTARAVEALHKLMPTAALRWESSNDGAEGDWREVSPEELRAGDVVKVLPGEIVPIDAVVVSGESALNQSSLTGESMPREVRAGAEVYAGTINVGNPLEIRVSRAAKESSLQRVLNLVMEAQNQREPIQRAIDRLSQPYAISVMVVSVAVLVTWWRALGVPLMTADGRGAVYTAITLLIVASPCALILATPTATLAAIARAARGGVLFKGGQSIERLSRVRAVAFDKTGTLTVGRPRVQQVHPIGWSNAEALLAVAAGLEMESTHPIATAIREAAKAQDVSAATIEGATFTAGRGMQGHHDGVVARLGSLVHTRELIPTCLTSAVDEVLSRVQQRGEIAVVVAWNGQAGVIVLSDQIRPGAPELVERLHALGVRPVCMLTGDNRATARHVADALGIDRWHAELLPEDKVAKVKELKQEIGGAGKGGVGVIGDGVNDAPALALADVAIGIGSIGSDAALESADIVLLSDDLSAVPWAVALSRRTRSTIRTNLAFSLSAIAMMVIATLVGSRTGYEFPLWMGVLGHEGGTLLVVANSLMLLGYGGAATGRAAGRR